MNIPTIGRHRHPDQRDRPDPHPDRLGAHDKTPFRKNLEPVEDVVARSRATSKEK